MMMAAGAVVAMNAKSQEGGDSTTAAECGTPTTTTTTLSSSGAASGVERRVDEEAQTLTQALFDAARNNDVVILYTSDQVCCAPDTGAIREKPIDAEENASFLRTYAASYAEIVAATVVKVIRLSLPTSSSTAQATVMRDAACAINRNRVHFSHYDEAVIQRIIARGMSLHCCGGFVVEDPDLSAAVEEIEGEGGIQAVQGVCVPSLLRLLSF
jgi:septum formation protein